MNRTYFIKLLRDNILFFTCFAIFLVVGAILLLQIRLGDEIFFFSDHRTEVGNVFFKFFTRMGEGILFALVALIFLFIRYRTAMFVPLLGIAVMLVSAITKQTFAHPRPWRYFQELGISDQLNLVPGVKIHSGLTSFPSGHAMAAFALYAFLAFILPRKNGVAFLLFCMALLVGASRIYLVLHFLQDVYFGATLGVAIAILFHYLHSKYPNRLWADRSLLSGRKLKKA